MKFIELNHVIEDEMTTYPGFPPPRVDAWLDHAASRSRYSDLAEFFIGRVNMVGNTGTYLDSPFHRFAEREDLSRIPLEHVADLPGIALDAVAAGDRAVSTRADDAELRGRAVLIRTGWDERWGSDRYWQPGPFLSSACLDQLIRAKAALVGVDFWNVDDTNDLSRPAHTRLLAAGILVVEHLCHLSSLPREGFTFSAIPLRIVHGASFPVRAFAKMKA